MLLRWRCEETGYRDKVRGDSDSDETQDCRGWKEAEGEGGCKGAGGKRGEEFMSCLSEGGGAGEDESAGG